MMEQTSLIVLKQEFNSGSSNGMYRGLTAVNPDNPNQIWTNFGWDMFVYSSNGGESYSTRAHPSPQNWQRSGNIFGITWHRGRLLAVMTADATWNGNGTGSNNRYWVLAQSSDTGNNWTVAQYDPTKRNAGTSTNNIYNNDNPHNTITQSRFKPLFVNGGWIFVAGSGAYQGSYYYYRLDFIHQRSSYC